MMYAHRHWLRPLGLLLLAPLAVVLFRSVFLTGGCDIDCGDQNRSNFVVLLLCTPFAAVGVLLLMTTARPQGSGRAMRAVNRLGVAAVAICVVLLTGAAIAAGAAGIDNLTGGGSQVHAIGSPEADEYSNEQSQRAGKAWLGVAAVLGTLAILALLALWAAWGLRPRRGEAT